MAACSPLVRFPITLSLSIYIVSFFFSILSLSNIRFRSIFSIDFIRDFTRAYRSYLEENMQRRSMHFTSFDLGFQQFWSNNNGLYFMPMIILNVRSWYSNERIIELLLRVLECSSIRIIIMYIFLFLFYLEWVIYRDYTRELLCVYSLREMGFNCIRFRISVASQSYKFIDRRL